MRCYRLISKPWKIRSASITGLRVNVLNHIVNPLQRHAAPVLKSVLHNGAACVVLRREIGLTWSPVMWSPGTVLAFDHKRIGAHVRVSLYHTSPSHKAEHSKHSVPQLLATVSTSYRNRNVCLDTHHRTHGQCCSWSRVADSGTKTSMLNHIYYSETQYAHWLQYQWYDALVNDNSLFLHELYMTKPKMFCHVGQFIVRWKINTAANQAGFRHVEDVC